VMFIFAIFRLFRYLLDPLPLIVPPPRLNNVKLYVDEDNPQYYWKDPSSTAITIFRGTQTFQHLGAFEGNNSLLRVEGEAFKDDKLLRVQEPGQQEDVHGLDRNRRRYLLCQAVHANWFDLALRFGQELTPYQWRKQVRKHPERKMVKLLGFDGGRAIQSAYHMEALNQLKERADVVLWDGDWYCRGGWTHIIRLFLEQKRNATAVAFQKRAEVPGFHRSFWELYQKFPNRIQIVVLDDVDHKHWVCPKPIQQRQKWLQGEFKKGTLDPPSAQFYKWLATAMISRKFQDQTPVIAMNGGKITTALAALETVSMAHKKIHWTVYETWKRPHVEERTLVEYAFDNPNENLTLICDKTRVLPLIRKLKPEGPSLRSDGK